MKATSNRSRVSSSASIGTREKEVRIAKITVLAGRFSLADQFVSAIEMFIYLGSMCVSRIKTASQFPTCYFPVYADLPITLGCLGCL